MGRYSSTRKFRNNLEYYDYLRNKRKLKVVSHYATPVLKHPTVEQRTRLVSDTHIWTLGDRYYKLADQYYGDSQYWWVIAWFNRRPTDFQNRIGDIIYIPTALEDAIKAFGV